MSDECQCGQCVGVRQTVEHLARQVDLVWYLRGHRRPLSECSICHGMQDNCPECSKENPPECQ